MRSMHENEPVIAGRIGRNVWFAAADEGAERRWTHGFLVCDNDGSGCDLIAAAPPQGIGRLRLGLLFGGRVRQFATCQIASPPRPRSNWWACRVGSFEGGTDVAR